MKKIIVLTLLIGLLSFTATAQISKTQVPVSKFIAYPIEIDSILMKFSNFDTLNFKDNTVGHYKLISPTSFNLSVRFSSLYGKVFDTMVYKKPQPKVKILMSFTLSPIMENTKESIINKLNTKDSLIYEGLIESKIFEDIPHLNVLNVDFKKYIELFAAKRYYLNNILLDIVFVDSNYAQVRQCSSFQLKQEIFAEGL